MPIDEPSEIDVVRGLEPSERLEVLTQAGKHLEQNLPDSLQASVNCVPAIAQFLSLLLQHQGINRGIYGFLLHDVAICICKGWLTPAAMMAGVAERFLDRSYQFLYGLSEKAPHKTYNATLGFLVSVLDEVGSGSAPAAWKVHYIRRLALHLAPYGNKRVPGLHDHSYEVPPDESWQGMPEHFYSLPLNPDHEVLWVRQERRSRPR